MGYDRGRDRNDIIWRIIDIENVRSVWEGKRGDEGYKDEVE